jgi:hypothetical protein
MLGNDHFYNRTIRKMVIAMGTVLNDIEVVRYTLDGVTAKEKFKVPLSYGAKEKYYTRITTDPDLIRSVNIVVPRISFEMTGMTYDSSRKMVSTMTNGAAQTGTTAYKQYVPVPYDFSFSASVYVRNTEDGTQIIEQIVPFFTPDFTVTATLVPQIGLKYDIPIILNSVSNEVDYEGDFSTTRLIIWNLEFTLKGYLFPPVKGGSKIIHSANTNIRDTTSANLKYANVMTLPDPSNAMPDDEYGFAETITEYPNA